MGVVASYRGAMETAPLSAAMLTGGRRLADPQLSPVDGYWVSVISKAGGRAELSLVDRQDGIEMQLPLEPGVASSRGGSHRWLPDGSGVVYIGVDGCVHVFDLARARSRRVTTVSGELSSLAVSPDGSLAAFVEDLQHVIVVALDGSGSSTRVSDGADFVVDPCFSADSSLVAWHEWDVPYMAWDESRIVVRDVAAGGAKRVVMGEAEVAVQQPRFSPDGRHLSFLCDKSGWLNVWSVDATTLEKPRPLFEESFDNGDLTWGPGQSTYAWIKNGQAIVVSRNAKGFGSLVERSLLDIGITHRYKGTFTNVHAAGDSVVGIVSDFSYPSELVVVQDGEATRAARGAYLGVEASAVTPEHVSWNSDDGVEIHGRLYRADVDGTELPPLLVWIHGGPHGQSPATFFARWQYFLDRGWSVLVPDYRGTNGYGREFLQSLRSRWGEADVSDVASGIDAAIRNKWADPSRIVPVGNSAGGSTALSVLAHHGQKCAAGVAMYPVTEFVAAAVDTHRFEAHYFDSILGPLPEMLETYRQRSPLTHAPAITAPVLLLHGTADETVPHSQSTHMAEAIAAAGGTVELQLYDGEGHGWRKSETQIDELERVHAFLCRYVLEVTTEGSK
jgi:dipeptidyl aminopeptidase/acylaminoacyl peptidase